MAMIKCPECGQDVSDKASVCIKCGFPISSLTPKQGYFYVKVINNGTVWRINFFNSKTDEKLFVLKPGESKKYEIDGAMSIYAKITGGGTSDEISLEANKTNKYSVSFGGLFLPKPIFTEVDVIDGD